MKTTKLLLITIVLLNLNVSAQELTLKMGENDLFSEQNTSSKSGTVYVIQDAALNALINKHILLTDYLTHTPGYRLQVFFNSSRTARVEAEKIQKRFKTGMLILPVYLEYKAPFWKVKLGDFQTKNEALRMKKKLAKDFPNSWIIKEMIQIKETKLTEKSDKEESLEEDKQ